MEEYLVKLSGKLQIKEAMPYLFKIFNSSDCMTYIYSDCLNALGEIGSKEIVEEIEKLYQPDNEDRGALAGILGKIPFKYSENLAIKLLQIEKGKSKKASIACSLCDLFSKKAIPYLEKLMEIHAYDTNYLELSEALVSLYEYYNLKYPDRLLIEDKKYSNKMRKKDPLFILGNKFRETFSQMKSNENECSEDVSSNYRKLSVEEKKKVILKFKKRMKKRKKR